jgi:hypothetical protein
MHAKTIADTTQAEAVLSIAKLSAILAMSERDGSKPSSTQQFSSASHTSSAVKTSRLKQPTSEPVEEIKEENIFDLNCQLSAIQVQRRLQSLVPNIFATPGVLAMLQQSQSSTVSGMPAAGNASSSLSSMRLGLTDLVIIIAHVLREATSRSEVLDRDAAVENVDIDSVAMDTDAKVKCLVLGLSLLSMQFAYIDKSARETTNEVRRGELQAQQTAVEALAVELWSLGIACDTALWLDLGLSSSSCGASSSSSMPPRGMLGSTEEQRMRASVLFNALFAFATECCDRSSDTAVQSSLLLIPGKIGKSQSASLVSSAPPEPSVQFSLFEFSFNRSGLLSKTLSEHGRVIDRPGGAIPDDQAALIQYFVSVCADMALSSAFVPLNDAK